MIRTLCITIWVGFATLVLGILVIVLSFFVRSGNPLHKIARFWGKSILVGSRIKVSVKGLSNIDLAAPYIYMPNHRVILTYRFCWDILRFSFDGWPKWSFLKFRFLVAPCARPVISVLTDMIANRLLRVLKWQPNKIKERRIGAYISGRHPQPGRKNPAISKKEGFVLAIDSGVPIRPGCYPRAHTVYNDQRQVSS